jgi:hypothetical protein
MATIVINDVDVFTTFAEVGNFVICEVLDVTVAVTYGVGATTTGHDGSPSLTVLSG